MKRDLAVDRFRGMAVILMVLGNALTEASGVPRALAHAEDLGYTFADAVAPLFVFAIALSYRPAFLKMWARFKGRAYSQYASRYLSLIGIGAILSAGGAAVGKATPWGVLQALGVAGLMTLAAIPFKSYVRLIAGIAVLAAFEFAAQAYLLDEVLGAEHGGILGAVSWGAMMILMTVAADALRKGAKPFILTIAAFAAVGCAILPISPISKPRVSASYALVSVAASGAWYGAVAYLTKRFPRRRGILSSWGVNPLALFLAHLPLVGLSRVVCSLAGRDPAPFPLAAACGIIIAAGLGYMAWRLYGARRGDAPAGAAEAGRA